MRTASSRLSLSPNPAREELHVQCGETLIEITVFDEMGRTVLHMAPFPPERPIDIRGLAPGMYGIRTRSHTNHLYHGRFQKIE